jgi:hypothetical protein
LYHLFSHLEQLLNIAWLLAVAGIVLATCARPHCRSRRFGVLMALVAFVCIAFVLFPVISASDDLHPASELSDDATRRHHQLILSTHLAALCIVIPIVSLIVLGSGLLDLPVLTVVSTHSGYLRVRAGRAPPLHFLAAAF